MDQAETTRADTPAFDAPALVAGLGRAAWLAPDGTAAELSHAEAAERLRAAQPLVCHGPATARRLGLRPPIAVFDLLELFAFVRPAQFALPTPRGMARALDLAPPATPAEEARALRAAARTLLAELADPDEASDRAGALATAQAMAAGGWAWAPPVLAALGAEAPAAGGTPAMDGLEAWRGLPEWADRAPEPPPGNKPVAAEEARARLAELLGAAAEDRPQQADYASAVSEAFQPREHAGVPRFVLAEAGTGVGKTLGYIAPASLWAEKNRGAVWISTYTRNLQHQIDQELDRLCADPGQKRRRVVLRKGRENYLCLLNMEEAAAAARLRSADAVPLGLLARWAARSRDGAVVGGDFPGWLADLVGRGRVQALTDHRGECIYGACRHYRRCYIEHSVRRARRADIVVANHALVMVQAALGALEDGGGPRRLVFDEGHHVFDAADSAFSGHLTGLEAAELRRWLRGPETRRAGSGRQRGLAGRAGDLVAADEDAQAALDAALQAARALPGEAWMQRLADGRPTGAAERFLALVRQQVYARADDRGSPYGLETETRPPVEGLLDAAAALDAALARLAEPMATLRARLAARLDDEADSLERETRTRIEALCRGLHRRGEVMLGAWRTMLQALPEETPAQFVDWLSVDRDYGRDSDVGLHRHWIDPTVPFAEAVAVPAHGVLVTSATLRDGSGDEEADWAAAEARTGAAHLPAPAVRAVVPSPFDYPAHTRVFIVTDVRKDAAEQVGAAMRSLFVAAGGGAIGLFTAIGRLRAVHKRIAPALEAEGLPLLAQHVDGLDPATLIDIFRAEENACLLGTDAVRDGVDVPGRALRLLVFDRVPWPRPDILHRARREAFGGRGYDDMLTRLRLKQAFGRLIRRADDRGVFVLLDGAMPTRLLGAFPEEVPVARVGLAEAVDGVATFFGQKG